MCSATAEVLWLNIKAASSDLLDLQAWISRENLDLHFYVCIRKSLLLFFRQIYLSVFAFCLKNAFESSELIINIFSWHMMWVRSFANICFLKQKSVDKSLNEFTPSYFKLYLSLISRDLISDLIKLWKMYKNSVKASRRD